MKIGDIVRLPSGSCAMTVIRLGHDEVEVCWMDYNDKVIYRQNLPVEALVIDLSRQSGTPR